MIHDAIVDILRNAAGLSALISNRIYPDILPQNPTLPALVYQQVASEPHHSHSGGSGFVITRMQFDSYSKTRIECQDVINEVREALQGYSNASPVQGTWVQAIFADTGRDMYDDKTQLRRHMQEFVIHHDESQT